MLTYSEFLEAVTAMAIVVCPDPFTPLHQKVFGFFTTHLAAPMRQLLEKQAEPKSGNPELHGRSSHH